MRQKQPSKGREDMKRRDRAVPGLPMHTLNKFFYWALQTCSIMLDKCRALWGEPEQAVCQGLQLRSSYTCLPYRTSCRGVEVGVAFSEQVSRRGK